MYYVLATELSSMLKAKDEDEDEEDDQAVKRKDTPRGPGMAMTYIYEPTRAGGVKEAGSIP
ncbi:MAG: hypothetical protein TREMPRED_001416, partial [Tremellales sp. Tagirdzhanova-0007]